METINKQKRDWWIEYELIQAATDLEAVNSFLPLLLLSS